MCLLVKIVFLACVLVASANPLTEDERKAMFADIIGKCQTQEGASDQDVADAVAHAPPANRAATCFHACVMESLGVMKDGKFIPEAGLKMAQMSGDPAKIKNAETVNSECHSVGGGDRCESVLELMTCVGQVAAKHGFDPAKDLH